VCGSVHGRHCFQKSQKTVHPDVAAATELVKQVDDIGRKLERVLVDEKQPQNDRAQAAQLLGKLRYTPAIPSLLRFRNWALLEDPDPDTDEVKYPCMDGLVQFGEAATPQMVSAWLEESNGSASIKFVLAFARAKTVKSALAIARSIASNEPNTQTKLSHERRITQLARYLESAK